MSQSVARENEPTPRWEPKNDSEQLEQLKGLAPEVVAKLKRRAQKQLFFMAKGVMGYADVNKATHGRFCKHVQDATKDRKLDLMPRGHLKSSIATEADSVRIACDDPNARILIGNEVLDNAQDFMSTIRAQFETNEFLRFLFPELILSRFSGPGVDWSGKSATLPRSGRYKEPTWMPIGVGGAVTSKHFTHLKLDDLIGLLARKSPAVLKSTIDWNRNIESLAINATDTIIEWVGTRWGKNDLYADIIRRYGADLTIFHRPVHESGILIFPEKYNWKFLRRIQDETPDIWAAQYMNDPTSDVTSDFDGDLVRYFQFDVEGNVVFRDGGKTRRWHWTQLDRVITVDPNGGSKTAPDEASIVVSATAPDENVFTLAVYAGRPTPTEFTEKLFKICQRWRPRLVGIEKAGQQQTRHNFEEKMKAEKVFYMLTDLKHGNRDKTDRIRTSLEPVIASQRLFLLRSQSSLDHQVKNFPDIQNDDQVDALAYGSELWRTPLSIERQKEDRDAVRRLLGRRNSVTGYGPRLHKS